MKAKLTITSKGQTTLPVVLRRKLGLAKTGGVLHIDYDENKGEAVISKPMTVEELSARITRYIKPETAPVLDVDDYYQKYRETAR